MWAGCGKERFSVRTRAGEHGLRVRVLLHELREVLYGDRAKVLGCEVEMLGIGSGVGLAWWRGHRVWW